MRLTGLAAITALLLACSSNQDPSSNDDPGARDGPGDASGGSDAAGDDRGNDEASADGANGAVDGPSDGADGPGTDGSSRDDGGANDGAASDGPASDGIDSGEGADGSAAGPIGSDDADVPYTGKYGQPITIRLPYVDKEWSINDEGTLVYTETGTDPALLIIELVRATKTTNSNAQYDAREGTDTVFLRDVFKLRAFGTTDYVYFDEAERRFEVGPTDAPAEFLLTNKYGSNIEKVDTDTYCKGVYDSFEYYVDVNARNTSCEFPYSDCYGRCAYRKLFYLEDGAYKTVGLGKGSAKVSIDGVSGYVNYEHLLP